ncbi:MAG: PA2779 family protein [Pseudomonadota bacterium]
MRIRSLMSVFLSAALILTTMPLHAEIAGTGQILAQETRNTQLIQVQDFMVREDMRGQMEALGVDSAQAIERVAAMTNSELQQLAENIPDAPPAPGCSPPC